MGIRGSYVSEDDIEAQLFGEPRRETIAYLRERVERYAPRISELFNGFFSDTREVFERYNGERALRRIRSRVRKTADVFSRDIIRPLLELESIQRAKPTMQRYIMAHPMSRDLKQRQEIDGYSDSNYDHHGRSRGFADPDFMRAIDGIIFDEDRYGVNHDFNHFGDDAWVAHQDIFEHDERDLDLIEQTDILSTWDILEGFYRAKKKDPTSILNEDM